MSSGLLELPNYRLREFLALVMRDKARLVGDSNNRFIIWAVDDNGSYLYSTRYYWDEPVPADLFDS